MLMTLMMMSLMSSITIMMITHPLSMGLILLIQTVSIALSTGFLNYNFWYSYIMFLIMIGGMLVLFIYMTSVASNEKFKFSFKLLMMISFIFLMNILLFFMLDQFLMNINNPELETIISNNNFNLSLNKYLNYPMNNIFYMIIIYLLITLIAVVKITDIKKGPLRQTN